MGRNNMAQDATKNEKVWKFDRCHVNIKVFNRTIITELGENIKQPTIQVDNDPAIDTVHHTKICKIILLKQQKHICKCFFGDDFVYTRESVRHQAGDLNLSQVTIS